MKLASLRDGSPEGRLVVVSGDLTRASDARHVAPSLRAALDDWERAGRELALIARGIDVGVQPVDRSHEREALAPLPAALPVGAPSPRDAFADPRGRRAPISAATERLRASIALVTGAVAAGSARDTAHDAVRLVMLAAGIGGDAVALSPVAATPDDFDDAAPARLRVLLDGALAAEGAADIDLAALVAAAARAAPIPSGAILLADPLAFAGAIDIGPRVSLTVEMRDPRGRSIFGAIERRPEIEASDAR